MSFTQGCSKNTHTHLKAHTSIVAAFSHNTRVDDHFVRQLVESGEDTSTLYAFSEGWGRISNGVPDLVTLPVGLRKMKILQLQNPIIEIDVADSRIDWETFTVRRVNDLLLGRIKWVRENLAVNGKVFINFRDFSIAMIDCASTYRILSVTEFLARLPAEMRPLGLIFEEPTGKNFPAQLGGWTAAVRKIMNDNGWSTGKLLVHVNEKWGLAEAAQLACL